MKNAKKFSAFAAMAAAVVCTYSARALDLPGAGETYTVPSGVTNVISDAEIDAYNALGLVEFTDETSALRFTASIAPNVNLKGRGWMIVDYPGDATLMITQQQTTAWIGTWDFRDGAIGLGNSKSGSYDALFKYNGGTGLHDVYVREGVSITFYNNTYCIHAYSDVRLHIAGRVNLSPGGYSPRLRQIEVDSDSAILSLGGSCIPDFMELSYNGVLYLPYINLNGHHLFSPGSGYDQACFQVRSTDLKIAGPGSMNINASAGTGIRVKSTSGTRGSLDITGGAVVTGNLEIAAYFPNPTGDFGCFGTVRQKDGSSFIIPYAPNQRPPFKLGGVGGGRPAYLLESGVLDAQNGMIMNGGTNVAKTSYTHFRQTGGDFSTRWIAITNLVAGLNADLAFGGSGTAKITNNGLDIMGDATFSFCDSVKFSVIGGIGNRGGHHIWAYNGGTAESRFLSSGSFTLPDGDFFALNGGSIAYGHTSAGTASDLFGSNPEIRVYERGGGIAVNSGETVTIEGVDFLTPKGNVLKSIEISTALTNTVFATPPSVVITDATGSNAAAVVDYDFDTKKVKGITIVSRGENYTAPTANLRYVDGSTLLATPLACTVGPEEDGDFTFSSTNLGARVNYKASTNYLHGSLVIDMDQLGLIDGSNRTADADVALNSVVLYFKNNDIPHPYFPNLTNIIIKSGALLNSSSYGYKHNTKFSFLSSCYSIEMYGGHLGGGSVVLTNFVIGGTAWLTGHQMNRAVNSVTGDSSPYWADVQITSKYIADGTESGGDRHANWRTTSVPNEPGTMVVDVDATPDSEPSKLLGGTGTYTYNGYSYHYGTLRFGGTAENPSTLTIKNYESLRKTKGRRMLLDLSANSINVFGTNFVNAVTPPDIADYGQIQWSPVARKLYWMPTGGLYLIFK